MKQTNLTLSNCSHIRNALTLWDGVGPCKYQQSRHFTSGYTEINSKLYIINSINDVSFISHWIVEMCFFFISSTCDSDMTAAIIKPITTNMSLAHNLFPPPLSACNHRLPGSALTDRGTLWRLWSLHVNDMRGSRGYCISPLPLHSSFYRSFNPAPHTTDRHLCSNIQQQRLWAWK